jgi:glutamate/tyrosine decarboxylase-like PLP-dependent enzyme
VSRDSTGSTKEPGSFDHLLARAAEHATAYRASLGERSLAPGVTIDELRRAFDLPFGDDPVPAERVVDELVRAAEGGLMPTAGPRYFGFVIGGSLDAAVAADVLTAGWDQCAFNEVLSPAASVAEEVAGGWLKELLGIPSGASVGFVTGGQAGNTVGLAAGRHHVLRRAGWDVERDGLHGAPPVRVVAGEERHATIDRALRLLGLGTASIEPVRAGPNGEIDIADLAEVLGAGPRGPVIVCLQAGNVNTGACDDLRRATDIARRHDAWVHVDGAFGLWAAASPTTRHLVDGVEAADSWACDGHKWLNLPYDSGFVFCAHPDVHAAAVWYTASYLSGSGVSAARSDFTLESSRRARGFAAWAGLRQLGRSGVADLVERNCAQARRFADGLRGVGATIANDVVLNQVLVDFGDDERTEQVIAAVQADGTCWMGGTTWRGRRMIRIAVSNHLTTDADVDRCVDTIARIVSE